MLSSSLEVQSRQVKTKPIARKLKQVVGHLILKGYSNAVMKVMSYLSCNGFVHSLSYLVDQAEHVAIKPASFEQIIRLLQHLRKFLGSEEFMLWCPSLYGGW